MPQDVFIFGDMSQIDLYALILCLFVFFGLTALFGVIIALLCKLNFRLIRMGAEDETIKKEYNTALLKGNKTRPAEKIISILIGIVLLIVFVFSLYVNLQRNIYFENVPRFKVVSSNSMAKKNKENAYLYQHGLDNQFSRFDMLLLYRVPAEDELKLYDIVVYEIDGISVIHRIVWIEEPNDSHPDGRLFTLQGDAMERPDRETVEYSQIKGIYRGEKIPVVGSFVFFLQSLPGWLCMALVLFAVIAMPILEKKLNEEKLKRLELMRKEERTAQDNSCGGKEC